YFGGAGRERTVHVDRQHRDAASFGKLEQRVKQLLRPADSERWDDDFPIALDGAVDNGADPVVHVSEWFVDPVAIGALSQQKVNVLRVIGIAEDVVVTAAEIAAKCEPKLPAA